MAKIKAILEIINSKADRAGNCYYAFTYTDNETGKSVTAGTSCMQEGNVYRIKYELYPDDPNCVFITKTAMRVRPFEAMMKDLHNVGSNPKDMAKWITEALKL
jgi:hypothetical protein